MGLSYAIGEARFSAAKIANTINESGIGQADPAICFEPEGTIRGGSGKVQLYSPDDQLLKTHLPRNYPFLLRG